MCAICGCGTGTHGHDHDHSHGHRHHDETCDHAHGHVPSHTHDNGSAEIAARARIVRVERDLLERNNGFAVANRRRFAAAGVFAVNLMSSPGSGKTTLLVRTIEALKDRVSCAVIEGDQQTRCDAERIEATGVPAIQINTGKGCHLDAHMVGHAFDRLAMPAGGILFIENVGNLVCPAAFDLGEQNKIVVLSVTEGEDKPLKYPDMFHAADTMILNKVDLLPHVPFDAERCLAFAREVNPTIAIMKTSALTGEGMESWLAWLERGRDGARLRAEAALVTMGE